VLKGHFWRDRSRENGRGNEGTGLMEGRKGERIVGYLVEGVDFDVCGRCRGV